MSFDETRIKTEQVNRNAASTNPEFVEVKFNIERTDEETRNLISATFGIIKNNIEAIWNSTGLEPNVNTAYQTAMTNPDTCFEVKGKKFYPHPGVGNLKAYNEAGNPSGGCFTMQTLA